MKLVLFLYRMLLSLRYKVKIIWLENINKDSTYLFLPNHVALVDPQILLTYFWKYTKVSPVASEMYYNMPVLKNIMDMVWTVPVWEISDWADSKDVEKVFWKIVESLKNWKNILFYPSWQIYRQWFESIIWKQMAYNTVLMMPENIRVLWVKTRWLWWSMFSKSWDNWKTWIFSLMLKWLFFIFANFVFFLPKREVNIELVDITDDINKWKKENIDSFNKNLEHFYNVEKEKDYVEEVKYLKHYFYYNDVASKKEPELITWSLKDLSSNSNVDITKVDNEIIEKIKSKIIEIKSLKDDVVIDTNTNMIIDLYFDSLDMAEIKSFVQSNFKQASNPPITSLKSFWDLVLMAVWQSNEVEKLKDCVWWENVNNWFLKDKFL